MLKMNLKKFAVATVTAGILVMGGALVGAQDDTQQPTQPTTEINADANGGRGQRGGEFERQRPEHDDSERLALIEQYTGLTEDELREAFAGDVTLADLITANGGDVDAYIADAVTAMTDDVNEAVAAGRLTQEQADEMIANAEARVTDRVNGVKPEVPTDDNGNPIERGQRGGRGGRGF